MNQLVMSEPLKKQTVDISQKVSNLVVTSNEQNEICTTLGREIKGCIKMLHDEFDPGVDGSYKNYKLLYNQRDKFLAPLETGFKRCKDLSSKFMIEQENIRIEDQRKEDEKSQREEDERKETLEKQAENWEKRGNQDKADERRQQSEEVHSPTKIVQSGADKQPGSYSVNVWKFKIENENIIPKEFHTLDEQKIRKYVNTFKQDAKISGVRIYSDIEVRIR